MTIGIIVPTSTMTVASTIMSGLRGKDIITTFQNVNGAIALIHTTATMTVTWLQQKWLSIATKMD
jgi:hypothetical protein